VLLFYLFFAGEAEGYVSLLPQLTWLVIATTNAVNQNQNESTLRAKTLFYFIHQKTRCNILAAKW